MPEIAQSLETTYGTEELKTPEKLVQFVVFTLCGEEYGLGILEVKEIVKTGQITMVPNMPEFIRGIINLRGKIIVIIDLEKRFLLQREKEFAGKHLVIVFVKESMFGLLVDEVTEVLRLPEGAIRAAPKLITEKIDSRYLTGVGTLKNRLIMLLDIKNVLSEEELVKLSEASGKHYRMIKPKEIAEEVIQQKEKPEEAKPKEIVKNMGLEKPSNAGKEEKPEEKVGKEKPKKTVKNMGLKSKGGKMYGQDIDSR